MFLCQSQTIPTTTKTQSWNCKEVRVLCQPSGTFTLLC